MQLESFSPASGSIITLKQNVISQLESVIVLAEEVAAREAKRVEKLRENFAAELHVLEGELREKKVALQSKEIALEELKENLSRKIQELEGQLRDKEELLQLRDGRLKPLESEMKAMAKRIVVMESVVEQAKEVSAGAAGRADRPREDRNEEINTFELQLRETEKALQAKQLALKELKESLGARIHELEGQLREKGQLVIVLDDQKLRRSHLIQAREEQLKRVMSELLLAKVKLAALERDGRQTKRRWKIRFWTHRVSATNQEKKSIDGDVELSEDTHRRPPPAAQKPSDKQPHQSRSLVLAVKRYFCF